MAPRRMSAGWLIVHVHRLQGLAREAPAGTRHGTRGGSNCRGWRLRHTDRRSHCARIWVCPFCSAVIRAFRTVKIAEARHQPARLVGATHHVAGGDSATSSASAPTINPSTSQRQIPSCPATCGRSETRLVLLCRPRPFRATSMQVRALHLPSVTHLETFPQDGIARTVTVL